MTICGSRGGSQEDKELTKGKEAKRISNQIILGEEDMKVADDKNDPDEDIGDNSRGLIFSAHCDSSVPEQGGNGPGIRAGNGWEMDKRGRIPVIPVDSRLRE